MECKRSEEFLPTLYNNSKIVVQNSEWNVKEITDTTDPYLERVANDTITKTVGLLNAFEYTKGGTNSNYLNNGQKWWLITPYSSSNVYYIDCIYDVLSNNLTSSDAFGTRPSIYLNTNVTFDTDNYDGTRLAPFHIVGDKEEGKANELLNTRISGEYVRFNNELYRIVGIDNNTTKIVNTSYITNPSSTNTSDLTLGNYGSDVYFNTTSADMNTGLVGLLRSGEMMSAQQSTLTHISSLTNYKYMWLITPCNSSYVRSVNISGGSLSGYDPSSKALGVRPTLHLKSGTRIISGSGFIDDPYVIG